MFGDNDEFEIHMCCVVVWLWACVVCGCVIGVRITTTQQALLEASFLVQTTGRYGCGSSLVSRRRKGYGSRE